MGSRSPGRHSGGRRRRPRRSDHRPTSRRPTLRSAHVVVGGISTAQTERSHRAYRQTGRRLLSTRRAGRIR
jgi:hypothetical protein